MFINVTPRVLSQATKGKVGTLGNVVAKLGAHLRSWQHYPCKLSELLFFSYTLHLIHQHILKNMPLKYSENLTILPYPLLPL